MLESWIEVCESAEVLTPRVNKTGETMKPLKICIDAGHGYKKNKPTGASGLQYLKEDNLALTVVLKAKWYLEQAGHTVVLTRPDNNFVDLASRGKIAKAHKCDRFVSIHFNASAHKEANGAEVLVVENDNRSAQFAAKLLEVLTDNGVKSRGVKWDNQGQHKSLRVLRDTYKAMPAALIEVCFLTSPVDTKRMTGKWLEDVCAGLAHEIAGYCN